jgi:hypothetical protein
MPNKHNALRRHHIPKMKFSVKNWAEYDAGLRRRGSLTLWVTPVLGRVAGGSPDDSGWPVQLLRAGHRDGHDAASGVSLGVASNRGIDGLHLRTAGCAAEYA